MLLLTILCILLTWWIGHCLQLISIHSFARHFVGLVAKHRARKSAHTYLNRPISILAIISQNFESEAWRRMIASFHRQFPSFLSLSLSFSFLPSFFLSINFGRVSSQLRRSASNGRAWNFLDRRRLHYDSKSVGDCVVAKIARGKRVIPRGSRHSRVFGYTCSLSPSLFPFRTRFRSVNFFTSPAAMPRDARAKIIADLRQINYKITRISRDSNISTRPNSRRFLEVSQGRRR